MNIKEVFNLFNNVTSELKFTMEEETDNQINFLDLTIKKEKNKNTFTTKIYRKPTATDSIFPADSCHPQEQKHAAIHHMINRMNSYNLSKEDKDNEKNTIEHILYNNKYSTTIINKLDKPKNNRKRLLGTKWAKFTYVGKETKFITKLFKDTTVNITYTTKQTIRKLLAPKPNPTLDKFSNSGVYQLTCPDCQMKYTGQTGRSFKTRFKEHFHDFKYNIQKSKFAQHLLNSGHSIGPTDDIMSIICTTTKGRLMNTIENFHIHKETHLNNQINDTNTVKPNFIFDVLIKNMPVECS
jgi:flagellar biosynthesis regulator FlaF